MKTIISGKLYNTNTMIVVANRDAYHNGSYCGSEWIGRTPKGHYAYVVDSNGQDLYRDASIEAIAAGEIAGKIDGWSLTASEIEELTALGILEEA